MDPHAQVIVDLLDRKAISPNNALWRAERFRLGHAELNAIWQAIGRYYLGERYDPAVYVWAAEPPADVCRECYRWDRDRQFGFNWTRLCGEECDHEHHRKDDAWLKGPHRRIIYA